MPFVPIGEWWLGNLFIITGQDYGEDPAHWQQWWEGQG